MKFNEEILKEFDLEPEEEKQFMRELLLRNEITHDYFNREMHQQKLIWLMRNCCRGALEVYEHIERYCLEHNFLELYANKNR